VPRQAVVDEELVLRAVGTYLLSRQV
jgi:hypothetical protein